jgi:signal transduction histidine kinase/ActR/RegA family two-component response regulator
MIGYAVRDLLTEKSRGIFSQVFPLFLQRGWIKDIELEFIRKDGSILPVSLSATALRDEAGSFMMSRSTLFDITERKKADEALRASEAEVRQSRDELSIANAALEKAARMKDDFLASMSHELRTPLTGILGLSEALQLNTYGEASEKQKKILGSIHDSGEHLLALINDILDLSKIEAGKLEIRTSPNLLSDICQSSLQLTKGMAHQKRQHVKYSAPDKPILLNVDARRVKQIIVNLLSNAIKFTPENGELGLDIEPDGAKQQIRLIVWDKGIGIEPENLSKLFQPFTQIDSSLAREYSGTGLGLSLVQRLADLHNGSVEVESVFGKGSRFIVTLPWTPQTEQAGSLAAGDHEESSPETVAENSSSPMILITDDNTIVLEMLTDFLDAKKYQTATAQNGKQLLEKIESVKPDIILMDIQMPGMDGLQTIRRVRNHKDAAIASTIIIAVTALAMSGDRERCLEAGANEYISKPLKLEELTKAIEYLLSSSREAKNGHSHKQ